MFVLGAQRPYHGPLPRTVVAIVIEKKIGDKNPSRIVKRVNVIGIHLDWFIIRCVVRVPTLE